MLLCGDARKLPLRDGCVQTVVTSPPYWGLRDYGVAGQIGLEATPEAYVASLVEVFREVRRVLRDDGTVWLNLGDSYFGPAGGYDAKYEKEDASAGPKSFGGTKDCTIRTNQRQKRAAPPRHATIKTKDLVGIPWMVAFALRADGWYLRSDIIWSKPNPMPESVTDRPTRAHEYLFLLTKRASYYYDHEGAKEAAVGGSSGRAASFKRPDSKRGVAHIGQSNGTHRADREDVPYNGATRNRRSVWTITTKPFAGAHFATFPPELVEPCVRAGTPEGGCCGTCEAPHRRVVEKGEPNLAHQQACGSNGNGEYHGEATKDFEAAGAQDPSATKARILAGMVERRTLGWVPTCDCPSVSTIPSLVLDPFGGSGTTVLVAEALGRRGLALELNASYLDIAQRRLLGESALSLPDKQAGHGRRHAGFNERYFGTAPTPVLE